MKIGILREEKNPPDRRVPFTPEHCAVINEHYPNVELVVQPSDIRCFKDSAYEELGLKLQEDLSDCDVLFGVKEVPVELLLPGKTYFYFSHTHKLQPYNRKLIREILKKKIVHVDYECLIYPNDLRIIGFGRYAGLVGAYNGLKTFGERTGSFQLKRASDCADLQELIEELSKVSLGNQKIVLTGSGRVARGADEILQHAKIRKVEVEEYLEQSFDEPVYCWIKAKDYVRHGEGSPFEFQHFIRHGGEYISNFERFTKVSDILITGHFWDKAAPVFFTKEQAAQEDFKIRVIADISCDIAGPIPSTLKASTIADPVYDYNRKTQTLVAAYSHEDHISVMAVDNLPCELPVDASQGFGDLLLEHIVPLVVHGDRDRILEKATFTTSQGTLSERYSYMEEYVQGS